MERAAFIIYLVVLILSPLLFGAVHTYAYTLIALGVLTGSLLLVLNNIKKNLKRGVYEFRWPNTGLNFFFIILLIFMVFQIIPLPGSLMAFLSPEAEVVGQKSLPASTGVISGSETMSWFCLAPYTYPVCMSIIRWTVYGLFFLSLIQLLNSRKRIELAVILVLMTGCFEALYGLLQTFSGYEHIWWYKKEAYLGDVTGTYINRNHFAGLMEMGILLAAAYAAGISERKKKGVGSRALKSSLRNRISRFLSGEQRFDKRFFIVFTGAFMGIGLFFSASRGGIIAAAGAMLCISLLFIFRRNHRRKGLIILFLFLIISVYAIHIGVDYTIGRFKYFDAGFEVRKRYAQKTIEMFENYKFAGVGVGNFQYAYPKYQAADDQSVFLRYAHNDWAQFISETGIIGLCLLLSGLSFFIFKLLKLWLRRRDPFAVGLGIAPLAVITAIGIHSYTDFNLHIPANFLMLITIMAIGYSALHLELHHGGEKYQLRYHIFALNRGGVVVLLMVLSLIFWAGFWTIRHFIAECHCNTVTNSTLNRDQNPSVGEIKKAILWDRCNAGYRYKLAIELQKARYNEIGTPGWGKLEQHKRGMEIIRALEKAVRLNPFMAYYHLRLGGEYSYQWQEPDYHNKWLPAADISMDRAVYFAGERPHIHKKLGEYWVMRSKTVYPDNPEWQMAWFKACRHYRKAQRLERKKWLTDKITQFIWQFYPDEEMVQKALLSD